jgi:hypothetical protein
VKFDAQLEKENMVKIYQLSDGAHCVIAMDLYFFQLLKHINLIDLKSQRKDLRGDWFH